MGFLDKLLGAFRGSGGESRDNAHYYYLRCNKCREVIRVRVDRLNDLAQDYDGAGDQPSGYITNKGVVGKKCFRVLTLTIRFDSRRNETSRSVVGGEYVTLDEYEAANA